MPLTALHRPTGPARFARLRRTGRGFTLIELMVVCAVIAILVGIAYPSYVSYARRGQLVDATNLLVTYRAQMERYFQDNRTYQQITLNSTTFTPPCAAGSDAQRSAGSFVLSCATGSPTATAYTLQAVSTQLGFTFTINQADVRATTAAPAGWNTCATGWMLRQGQTC